MSMHANRWIVGLDLRPSGQGALRFARWLARATWFRNDYAEQIAYAPSPGRGGDGVADYVNIDGSRAGGDVP